MSVNKNKLTLERGSPGILNGNTNVDSQMKVDES
jgi:hypothetical protein